jgi:hypothetical protein
MIEASDFQKVTQSVIKPLQMLPLVKSQTVPRSSSLDLYQCFKLKDLSTVADSARYTSNCEKKIKKLEKSLDFIKDQNQILIKYLFHEIEELKKKNRGELS